MDPDVILNVNGVVPGAPVMVPPVDLVRVVPSGALEAREEMAPEKEDESARDKAINKWLEILDVVGDARRSVRRRRKISRPPL